LVSGGGTGAAVLLGCVVGGVVVGGVVFGGVVFGGAAAGGHKSGAGGKHGAAGRLCLRGTRENNEGQGRGGHAHGGEERGVHWVISSAARLAWRRMRRAR